SSAACAWSISFCGGPEHAAARINTPTMSRRRTPKVYHAMKPPAPQDAPRENPERAGASVLGDSELLAVVLGHGGSATDALALANAVLSAGGGPHRLRPAPPDELRRV